MHADFQKPRQNAASCTAHLGQDTSTGTCPLAPSPLSFIQSRHSPNWVARHIGDFALFNSSRPSLFEMEDMVIENLKARELFQDALSGRSNRRDVVKRAAALGLAAPVIAALGQAAHFSSVSASTEGTLNVTYYDWILNLHPSV